MTCVINFEELTQWSLLLKSCRFMQLILYENHTDIIFLGFGARVFGSLCNWCWDERKRGSFFPSVSYWTLVNIFKTHSRVYQDYPGRYCLDGWLRVVGHGTEDRVALICSNVANLQYYGEFGQFTCRCLSGYCTEGSNCITKPVRKCPDFSFGQNCQYRDLVKVSLKGSKESEGDDADLCDLGEEQLSYTFDEPIIFTWVRIVFLEQDAYAYSKNVQLQLFRKIHEIPCEGRREVKIDNRTVDIVCSGSSVTEVLLALPSSKRICSIHINGDRNIALGQKVKFNNAYETEVVVDGDFTVTSPCSMADSPLSMWSLDFDRPRLISEIIIHTSPNAPLNLVTLDLVSKDAGASTHSLFHDGIRPPQIVRLTITPVEVSSIIVVNKEKSQPIMTLCEIEVYGDCVPPYYGSDCNSTCSKLCLQQKCNAEGKCLTCEGEQCKPKLRKESVLCHCTECDNGLTCKKDSKCVRGWFGDFCQLKDLAAEAIKIKDNLTDNDVETCTNSKTNFEIVEFANVTHIEWIRLTFFESVEDLELRYYSMSTTPVVCQKRILEREDQKLFTYDIGCHHSYHCNMLMVKWKRPKVLCSLHIFGGRSLAIMTRALLGNVSQEMISPVVPVVVDGNKNKCVDLEASDDGPFLTLSFTAPVFIFSMVLHLNPYNTSNSRSVLEVNSVSDKGDVLDTKIFATQSCDNMTLEDFPQIGMTSVKLMMIRGYLTVCEVEILGECAPPLYGHRCQNACSKTCYHQLCYLDGSCWNCNNAHVQGKLCTETDLKLQLLQQAFQGRRNSSEIMLIVVCILILMACGTIFLYQYQNKS